MSEIESSGSVDFTNPATPESGVLYDAATEKAAVQQARTQALMYDSGKATSWAEATSREERTQKHVPALPAHTGRKTRAAYHQKQDWRRTVRGVTRQMQTHHQTHQDGWVNQPAKGVPERWRGTFVEDLYLAWREFWTGRRG